MKAAQDAEFDKLIIAGEPLSKKEQKKLQTTTQPPQQEQKTSTEDNEYRQTVGEIPTEE